MAQNMEDVTNVMQFVQMAQGFGPEGQATPKMGEITDYIADKLGIPTKLRFDSAERQYNLQQAAQMAAQAAQQNPEIGAGGETDKKILDLLGSNMPKVQTNA